MSPERKKRRWKIGLHPLNWLYCGIMIEIQLALVLVMSASPREALHTGGILLAAMLLIPWASASIVKRVLSSGLAPNVAFAVAVTAVQVVQVSQVHKLDFSPSKPAPSPPAMVYGKPVEEDPTRPRVFAENEGRALPAMGPVPALPERLFAAHEKLVEAREELARVAYLDPARLTSFGSLSEHAERVATYKQAAQDCVAISREVGSHLQASAGRFHHLLASEESMLQTLREVHRLDLQFARSLEEALRLLTENLGAWELVDGRLQFENEVHSRDFARLEQELLTIGREQIDREAEVAAALGAAPEDIVP